MNVFGDPTTENASGTSSDPDTTFDTPAPKSSRQQRYDELVAQGLSSADALAQEDYEYRTKRDNGLA